VKTQAEANLTEVDMYEQEPSALDVAFPLLGEGIALDHGYTLYAALCSLFPAWHGADWLGIHPIFGHHEGPGRLRLGKHSALVLRVPPGRLRDILPLSGKSLPLGDDRVRVGLPQLRMLRPASALVAHRVTLREVFTEADASQRLFQELHNKTIVADFSVRRAQPLSVKGMRMVCFRVQLSGLSAENSVRLQVEGLGGRRRMGCGLLVPRSGGE
jgi:CRISPR-associated endonuclease/helicase Cas3